MELTPLTAISPIDGRYSQKTDILRHFFSEFALIKNRYQIEIEWLLRLAENDFPEFPTLSEEDKATLREWQKDFDIHDAEAVKEIEKDTNHDVKAVEYFLKRQCEAHPTLTDIRPFIHLACTSADINNLSYAKMFQAGRAELLRFLGELTGRIKAFASEWAQIPMLARTHGQPASPTTVGKEFAIFYYRLERQMNTFQSTNINGKCNGATGNYNAHVIAYPEFDWISFTKQFVESLGFVWNPLTTQIEPHDYIAELSHNLIRINTILIDFSRDIWRYISNDYFKQKILLGEIGSSTMPHKVNPIDFENAEGNCRMANAILQCFSDNLPISRWQRDLVDSTIMRNFGVAFGHCFIAYQSLIKGINKLQLNEPKLIQDLEQNWSVLAEAIQSVMRRYQIPDAYEQVKELTRGKQVTQNTYMAFIDKLDIPKGVKSQLKALTPAKYIGKAPNLCRFICEQD